MPGPVGPGLRILLWGGTVFSVRHLNNKAPADFPSGLLPGTRGVRSCCGEKGYDIYFRTSLYIKKLCALQNSRSQVGYKYYHS